MKKTLINWLLFTAFLTTAAQAQVPVQGSIGQFGTVVGGANGLGAAPWTPGGFTQGSWLAFNNNGGSNGETDFINYHPSLTGGFAWFSPSTSSLGSQIMHLDNLGNLSATSFIGPLTGNVNGNLAGNATGTAGQFGRLVVACNGCGGTAWSPGSFTSGTWLAQGNAGGSNLETDFINYATSGTRGFKWYSPSSGTLGSPTMSLDSAGNLTATSFVGNATTASALAATPNGCTTTGTFAVSIDSSGNLTCSAPLFARTTTVNATAAAGLSTASSVVPLSSTMPDTNYSASCSMVNVTGFPFIYGIAKTTTNITVSYSNGASSQAVVSTAAEIDCTISGT